jgi:hypothetical protein
MLARSRQAKSLAQLLGTKARPDPTEFLKVTVVTAADEQIACGVGYYP